MNVSKEFDCILHDIISAKPPPCGFSFKMVTCLNSYLGWIDNVVTIFLQILPDVLQGPFLGLIRTI